MTSSMGVSTLALPVLLFLCLVSSAVCSNDTEVNIPVFTQIQEESQHEDSKLLVILVDGLRWDWINTSHTEQCAGSDGASASCSVSGSFFTRAQEQGSTAAWNTPVFPTTLSPNAFTIVTGVLPADHGILGSLTSDGGWTYNHDHTPFWQTVADAGKNMAMLGVIDSCQDFRQGPLVKCVDRVPLQGRDNHLVYLEALSAIAAELLVETDTDIVMMYTETLTWVAKHFGTESNVLQDTIEETELIIDKLFEVLDVAGLWKKMNVMIVSPHGLTSTSPAKIDAVSLSKCLPDESRYRYRSGGSAIISPHTSAQELIQTLEACESEEMLPEGAVSWHSRTDLPPSDQWQGDDEEILIVAAEGFVLRQITLLSNNPHAFSLYGANGDLLLGRAEILDSPHFGKGFMAGSGYEPILSDMNGVLIVKGPDLYEGITGPAVLQTDVYQLLCHMAKVTPVLNKGQWESVEWMIDTSAGSSILPQSTVLLPLCIVILLCLSCKPSACF